MAETKDMIILQFDTVLEGKAARALKRITDMVNHDKSVRKSESKVAFGLLKFILEHVQNEHNVIIGVTSSRKEY